VTWDHLQSHFFVFSLMTMTAQGLISAPLQRHYLGGTCWTFLLGWITIRSSSFTNFTDFDGWCPAASFVVSVTPLLSDLFYFVYCRCFSFSIFSSNTLNSIYCRESFTEIIETPTLSILQNSSLFCSHLRDVDCINRDNNSRHWSPFICKPSHHTTETSDVHFTMFATNHAV